ncbi:major facilitator superfamily domain-containing protein [Lentinula guzmanii]|uniref:Major facilitator superfamily domain-containing protein n=1 Tax=Lentinula guzmanii TaxID=2804957 RepID=A0AA38JBR9_9AGAR|nr:major facilitator superfamily domain-containing protein [Lentinula guzmanii]KAJ3795788.1 major facilitator superfamily domain-containing protein [Lentinula aff. detonsa]
MSNKQYSIALTVTYVPYILSELPSNLMLKAVGPNLMLPTMLTLWGIVTALQGIVNSYPGLLACRFFIGLLEGGVFPGLFLSPEEKAYVKEKLLEDTHKEEEVFSWKEVIEAFKLPQLWLLGMAFFFAATILFGLAYFSPSIIQGLGYTAADAQLMSVPPYAVACVVALVASFISDRYRCRGIVCIVSVLFCAIGFAMFLGSQSKRVQYGSLFFSATGAYMAAPTQATWNANNASPQTRRATVIAMGFILANSGGIVATWLLGSLSPAPRLL